MNPVAKFHSYAVAISVAVMFLLVNLAVKFVPDPSGEDISQDFFWRDFLH